MNKTKLTDKVQEIWKQLCQKQLTYNSQFLSQLFQQIQTDNKKDKQYQQQVQQIDKEDKDKQNGKTEQLIQMQRRYSIIQIQNEFKQNEFVQDQLNQYLEKRKAIDLENQLQKEKRQTQQIVNHYHKKLRLKTQSIKKKKNQIQNNVNEQERNSKNSRNYNRNRHLQLFRNQELNLKISRHHKTEQQQQQQCEEEDQSQMYYLPTHKMKFNRIADKNTEMKRISKLQRLQKSTKNKKKSRIKQLLQEEEERRKNQQIERILLEERISNQRLKRIYSKKSQLHHRLQLLNQEVINLKEKQKKQKQFKKRLQNAGTITSHTNSRIYHLKQKESKGYLNLNNPQNKSQRPYFRKSNNNSSMLGMMNINSQKSSIDYVDYVGDYPSRKVNAKKKNVKCITQQEQSEIEKSKNAIQFIMDIRKRERQRREKLQLSLKKSRQKERQLSNNGSHNNDFSRLIELNQKSVLLPSTN